MPLTHRTPRLWALLLVVLVGVLLNPARAQTNVTVDDIDPQIVYNPPTGWDDALNDPLNYGGSHKVTADSSATATFTFVGTAIYFYSSLWPFDVTTAVSIDGAPPVTISLRDPTAAFNDDGPETVMSTVVWGMPGLTNGQHTLVVSVAAGSDLAVLDALVYTTEDTTTTTTTTALPATSTAPPPLFPTSPSSPSSTPGASAQDQQQQQSPSTKKALRIAVAIVASISVLLVLLALAWWLRKRRQRELERKEEEEAERRAERESPLDMGEVWSGAGSGAGRYRSGGVGSVPGAGGGRYLAANGASAAVLSSAGPGGYANLNKTPPGTITSTTTERRRAPPPPTNSRPRPSSSTSLASSSSSGASSSTPPGAAGKNVGGALSTIPESQHPVVIPHTPPRQGETTEDSIKIVPGSVTFSNEKTVRVVGPGKGAAGPGPESRTSPPPPPYLGEGVAGGSEKGDGWGKPFKFVPVA